MDRKRLRAIVAAYGARADRWPEKERAAALEVLSQQQDPEAELQEAQALDALLEAVPEAGDPHRLIRKIMRQATNSQPAETFRERLVNWLWPSPEISRTWLWGSVSAAVLPFALGLALGGSEGMASVFEDYPVRLADAEQHWALELQVAGFDLPLEPEEEL